VFLKQNNRDHPPASWRYLEERRWTLLAAKATEQATGIVSFDCWSRQWWGLLLAKSDRRDLIAAMVAHACRSGSKIHCAPAEQMPSDDQIASLKAFPSDGDAMASWRIWFERLGARFPLAGERFWVYLPAPLPPTENQSVWESGRDAAA
jgi:hypothetical protein